MEQMLTCLQISLQLKGHVELYNQQYPQNNSLRDITDNIIIYNEIGCYVRILKVLVGNGTGKQYKEFDWLCQCYQAKQLAAIPQNDANRLWELFHLLKG